MSLHDTMIKHGNTFFRWRGLIPLLFIGPLVLALRESAYMETLFGETLEDIWVFLCFAISLVGLVIRGITVGYVPGKTSGRNTSEQRAEILNTTGMYSVVRNPLYLGNFIMILGVMLSIKVWWLCLIITLVFFIYMERIILAEESFLHEKFGEIYGQWREKTPAIIPNTKLWNTPEMTFSWKTVLKREYPGFLAIGTAFTVIEMASDVIFEGKSFTAWIKEDFAWPVIFGIILVASLTVRHLKKHTNLLKVEGR